MENLFLLAYALRKSFEHVRRKNRKQEKYFLYKTTIKINSHVVLSIVLFVKFVIVEAVAQKLIAAAIHFVIKIRSYIS